MAVDCDRLKTQQLEQGSYKDVGAGGEDIGPQEAAAVGAAALGHAVEQAHRLLQHQLEFSGHIPEPGDDKDADQDGGDEKGRRDQKGGDHPGVDRFETEEADPVDAVEHRVPHGLLHALRPAGRAGEQGGSQQDQHRDQPDRQSLFVLLHQGIPSFKRFLCRAPPELSAGSGRFRIRASGK